MAKARNCDGVICGHIHTPADKIIDGVHYLNSGDWVESMTAIVEHMDGKVEVLEYNDFLKKLDAIKAGSKKSTKITNTAIQCSQKRMKKGKINTNNDNES